MNNTLLEMKDCGKAMHSYILTLYEICIESKPDFVLEIGVGTKGQSTKTILSALEENKKGKLFSIDTRGGDRCIDNTLQEYWELLQGDSHSDVVYNRVKDYKFDILFIDGDHSYEGVKKDFEMYVPLVKDRGLVLMHDITNANEGVPKFWQEIKYPKVSFEFGILKRGILPGFGIVQIFK